MNEFRRSSPILRIFRLAAGAGLAVLLLLPGRSLTGAQQFRLIPEGFASSPASSPGHIKLQSSLARLVEIRRSLGAASTAEYARLMKMDLNDGRLLRVVTVAENIGGSPLETTAVQSIRFRVESLGGRIETTYRRLVQHTIPIEALEALADDPLVRYIRLPFKPFLQTTVSEGVAKIGANQWQGLDAFRRVQPAKVCILDIGFQGYTTLLGKDLPKTVTARSFRADGDITGGGEVHGAACAEIVHDVAPEAKMYLVNFGTDVEQHNAVEWIIGQGVDVISYSIGWFNSGAGDGTGPIDADVDYASARGLAWVNSSGNSAHDHWSGTFSDPDGNGAMNFDAAGTEMLTFHVPANETVGVFLNWKDFGPFDGIDYRGSDQDFDLELYINNNGAWQFVDSSTNRQTGSQWPTEEIYGYYANAAATWGLKIKKINVTKTVDLEVVVMGNDQDLLYYNPARSILVPADSPSALTTGATSWQDDSLHYYSGRGPTWDNRMKPDFTAPSGVSTTTYGPQNFYGTSASAPHLAGAIALLKGMTPYSIAQIKTILINRAVDLGAVGPDNLFGHGRISVAK
jgi:hypothetical protein